MALLYTIQNMERIKIKIDCFSKEQIKEKLKQYGIRINHYAEEYFSHSNFSLEFMDNKLVVIASLKEIGFENGATLPELFNILPQTGLKPCSVETGLLLRLVWKNQPESQNNILSGTHEVPNKSVTVLSEFLEQNNSFPKGLYLRNVDVVLWLRGYICDLEYVFPGDALFAFEEM